MHKKVLIVEDDQEIFNYLTTLLEGQGMDPVVASRGWEAKSLFTSCVPDVVLLDLGLPDMDGAEVVRFIREEADSITPIIAVTARTDEAEKVRILDLGADDYITKPFGANELVARIRSVVRRTKTNAAARIYQSGDLYVDMDRAEVRVEGVRVKLTEVEQRILLCLIKDAGKVVTNKAIYKEIWGVKSNSNASTLRVNIGNIRRKIEKVPAEPKYVFTDPGVGYMIRENEYKKKQPEEVKS